MPPLRPIRVYREWCGGRGSASEEPGRVSVSGQLPRRRWRKSWGQGLGKRGPGPSLPAFPILESESEQMAEAMLTDPRHRCRPGPHAGSLLSTAYPTSPGNSPSRVLDARQIGRQQEANDRVKHVLIFWYFFQCRLL